MKNISNFDLKNKIEAHPEDEGKTDTTTKDPSYRDERGWGQDLKLKCCYEENRMETEVPIPSLVFFYPWDDNWGVFSEQDKLRDFHALDSWLNARSQPSVFAFGADTADLVFEQHNRNEPIMVLALDDSEASKSALTDFERASLSTRVHTISITLKREEGNGHTKYDFQNVLSINYFVKISAL